MSTFRLFNDQEYELDWATCRTNGHAWEIEEIEVLAQNIVARKLICRRHNGIRIDDVHRVTGVVLRHRYRVPKGYYVRGHGALGREIFRREVIESELKTLGGHR